MEQAPFPAEPSYQPALISFKALLKVSAHRLWREKFREHDGRGAAGCPGLSITSVSHGDRPRSQHKEKLCPRLCDPVGSRPEVPALQVDEGLQEAGPRRETGHFCMIHTSSSHICLFGYMCVCSSVSTSGRGQRTTLRC